MKNNRRKWLIIFGFIALLVAFIAADTALMIDYLKIAERTQTSYELPSTANFPNAPAIRGVVFPFGSADSHWWVLHTTKVIKEKTWRVRSTSLDNHPAGREVHWNSGFIWVIALFAHFRSWFSSQAPVQEVSAAALGIGPICLCLVLLLLGATVWYRWGSIWSAFYIAIFATYYPIFETFRFGEADHHGLNAACLAGVLLGLVGGGLGMVRQFGKKGATLSPTLLDVAKSRLLFRISGIFGGVALWISASSTIPVLLAVGLFSIVSFWTIRKTKDSPWLVEPHLWFTWGKWGCGTSLFFYFLEYFPSHFGLRLEVNHPFYAFAWLGGSWILARSIGWLYGQPFLEKKPVARLNLLAALIALGLPPTVLIATAGKSFWVSDPFLLQLHLQYISEFQPLWPSLVKDNLWTNLSLFLFWPILGLVAGISLLIFGRLDAHLRCILVFALLVALVMQVQAFTQIRWSNVSSSIWTVVILLEAWILFGRPQAIPIPKIWARTACLAGLAALLAYPIYPLIGFSLAGNDQQLAKTMAPMLLNRDIAHRLRANFPGRPLVVLAPPTTSTFLTYFGDLPTIGTLYWENLPGLRAAAHIYNSPDADTALARMQALQVTHLVWPSWDTPANAFPGYADGDRRFFDAITTTDEFPQWLRPYSYVIPDGFGISGETVKIFEIAPQQTDMEAAFFLGIYHAQSGTPQQARLHLSKVPPGHPFYKDAINWLKNLPKD